ncbi:GMC family oxidoreductase [Cupriavidus plantarum]|uniref:GMC family oxidoreductase n=1 Tax=Cupriavidus plantarum TaxID=942865 RepID=UPI0015CCA217|nr:GMC family oxidoreductase [Cupriavidus plantarum]NYI02533.1 cholesterol oxidase [Cupriavidus plantarum]
MSACDYDAIVIGSGFGGAVSACRLAQAGRKVLVLERGREWTPGTYPRGVDAPWLWDQAYPHRFNGWADLRTFRDVWVIAGAGVGGGSLIYANVSVEAKPEVFLRGWPPEITYEVLQPYYEEVGRMLDVQTVPAGQESARERLMREAAERCGWGDRFRKLPLAVSFSPNWSPNLPDARADRHSVAFVNAHGKMQGTCVHCGNCDIGCQVSAKNTLDLNYLAVARTYGAEIWPLHLVHKLEPLGKGWRVHFERLETGTHARIPGSVTGTSVLLAAGSIGSTELLLRCRDEHRTLRGLSPRLGFGWAHNGDFVTPAFYPDRRVSPSHGVTISCVIDLLDRAGPGFQSLFVEDGGIPDLAHNFIHDRIRRSSPGKLRRFWRELGAIVSDGDPLETMMPWFGQALEPGDGQLLLRRKWYAPWRRALNLSWSYRGSAPVIESMIAAHRMLSEATGGRVHVPPTWTVLRNLVTPHPLGGCNMGASPADGVVDGRGRVFGYDGLYVMDGAIVPRALGLNPSRTIAALAERNVALMLH